MIAELADMRQIRVSGNQVSRNQEFNFEGPMADFIGVISSFDFGGHLICCDYPAHLLRKQCWNLRILSLAPLLSARIYSGKSR